MTTGICPASEGRGIGPTIAYHQTPIHNHVAVIAETYPDRIAVVHGNETWSYKELVDSAESVALCLIDKGLVPGDVVALQTSRSLFQIAEILGILQAGCVYLPLDTSFPAARIQSILKDAAPRARIVDGPLNSGEAIDKLIEIPRGAIRNYAPSGKKTPLPSQLDTPMYLIYTSGTTGKPKGIVQTHRTITNLINWQNNLSGIDFSRNVLQYSSIGFDVHLQEIFSPLSIGGTLCLIDQLDKLDPDALVATLAKNSVAVLFLPVAVLSSLGGRLEELPVGVEDVIVAGEQLVINEPIAALLTSRPKLKLHNHYGVSESHVVTAQTITGHDYELRPSIGKPISNTRIAILNNKGAPAIDSETGELWISGDCLAQGYYNLPGQTHEAFVMKDGERWYRTGDFGRWRADGGIDFLGRADDQVKIGGALVRLGDVEAALQRNPSVRQCAVIADESGVDRKLIAYIVADRPDAGDDLRLHASAELPLFMVPSLFIVVDELPMGPTGKVDRQALAKLRLNQKRSSSTYRSPSDEFDYQITEILSDVLGLPEVGMDDAFEALGMTSLSFVRVASRLSIALGHSVSPLLFFQAATPAKLKEVLWGKKGHRERPSQIPGEKNARVAIIGLAGLFPGADSVEALVDAIGSGKDLLSKVEDEHVFRSTFGPTSGESVPQYGPVNGSLRFDYQLFGLSRADALWMDPQQRKFLEQAWACLEDAGIDPVHTTQRIGVYAGCSESTYLFNVRERVRNVADYLMGVVGADKDFIATRVAYHLGLTGPAINVQSACSTGLMAVHQAVRAIQAGDCEIALAGASSLSLPDGGSLPYVQDTILSADGETRPFDQARSGTCFTNAVAIVCLKSYERALEDGDPIRAVVRGISVTNDGNRKSGFAAPSLSGQRDTILAAMREASADPKMIGFVETHGTATKLGDQVELEALKSAYDLLDESGGYACGLTSIKSWVGHTNRAAGTVGLISSVNALEAQSAAPVRNFKSADPSLSMGPFHVLARQTNLHPLTMAGVSSFGIGGTNVHAVIERAPVLPAHREEGSGWNLFLLSARTDSSLKLFSKKLAESLLKHPRKCRDVAKTLAEGRACLDIKDYVVADSPESLVEQLKQPSQSKTAKIHGRPLSTAFIIPGIGVQHARMGHALMQHNLIFRSTVAEATSSFKAKTGIDLEPFFTGEDTNYDLGKNSVSYPLLLLIGVGVGRALIEMGVKPDALIGHSSGEYVCAVLSGCMALDDALYLVSERGRLMDETSISGIMATVAISESEAQQYLVPHTYIAGVNNKSRTLIAGESKPMQAVLQHLERDGIATKVLPNTVPNHTPLLKPLEAKLASLFDGVPLFPPTIPYISSTTGEFIKAEEAISPAYWSSHLSAPAMFLPGLKCLEGRGVSFFVEIGALDTMCQLARSQFPGRSELVFIPAVAKKDEVLSFYKVLGEFWRLGGPLNRFALSRGRDARRISLPSYSFEGEELWLNESVHGGPATPSPKSVAHEHDVTVQVRHWQQCQPAMPVDIVKLGELASGWVVISETSYGQDFAKRMEMAGIKVSLHSWADAETLESVSAVLIFSGPENSDDRLVWGARLVNRVRPVDQSSDYQRPLMIFVSVGEETPMTTDPAFDTLAATIALERPDIICRYVCFDGGAVAGDWQPVLVNEIRTQADEVRTVRYKERHRLIEGHLPIRISETEVAENLDLQVWMLVGGAGAVGNALTQAMAGEPKCKIAIVGRSAYDAIKSDIETQLGELERAGHEAIYIEADATDCESMKKAVQAVTSRWGRLDVLLHLAAAIDYQNFLCLLPEISRERVASQVHPKINGLVAISEALQNNPRTSKTIAVAFSSIAALFSGQGYAAYAYANRLLLEEAQRAKANWRVIHWDIWTASQLVGSDSRVGVGSSRLGQGIDGETGLKLLTQILRTRLTEATVLMADIQERLAKARADKTSPPSSLARTSKENDLLRVIKDVWADRLAVEDLPDDANFLTYGGDSLTAIKVILDLREILSLSVSPSVLLNNPCLTEFAAAIREQVLAPETVGEAEPRTQENGKQSYQASPLQLRWYEMHEQGFGNLIMPVMIYGPIDAGRLEESLKLALERHDVFRTRYLKEAAGIVAQESQPDSVPRTSFFDIANLPITEQAVWIRNWARKLEMTLLPIDNNAPVKPYIVRCSENETLLVIHTHHICFDGWSASLLLDTIGSVYDGKYLENTAPTSREASEWTWEYLRSEQAKGVRRAWFAKLKDIPSPTRPEPDLGGATSSADAVKEVLHLGKDDVELLRIASRSHHATLYTSLLSAFSLFLQLSSGTDDVLLGTTAAGRVGPHSGETVGVFVNPLPLRVNLVDVESVADVVARVKSALDLFHESQGHPVTDLVDSIPALRKRGLNGMFRSYLLYQNHRQPSQWDSCTVDIGDTENSVPSTLLSCFEAPTIKLMRDFELIVFDAADGGLTLNFWYRQQLYSHARIRDLVQQFRLILKVIAHDSDIKELRNTRRHVASASPQI